MAEMKHCCRCHKDKANDEFKEGRKSCITCLEKWQSMLKTTMKKCVRNVRDFMRKKRAGYFQRKEKETRKRYGVTVVEQKLERMDGKTI